MNTFIIFFVLTNVNLTTAIFITLHYFSVVWLYSSVLLRFILEGKVVLDYEATKLLAVIICLNE